MDVERTAQHWLIQAAVVLRRVTGAERRFAVSLKVNEVTMLAAADELGAATRDATSWIAANVCPDLELEGRVVLMLDTCAEVALTAQRAVISPLAATEAVLSRLVDLLAVIDFHSQALEDW